MKRSRALPVVIATSALLIGACGGNDDEVTSRTINTNVNNTGQSDGAENGNVSGDNTEFCENFEGLMETGLEVGNSSFGADEILVQIESLEFPAEIEESGEQLRATFSEMVSLSENFTPNDESDWTELFEREAELNAEAEPAMEDIMGYVLENCPSFTEFVDEKQVEVQATEAHTALRVTQMNAAALATVENDYGVVTVENLAEAEPNITYTTNPVNEPGAVMVTTSPAGTSPYESWAAMVTKADNNYCYAISVPRTEDATQNPAGNTDGQIMYGTSSSPVDGPCSTSEITVWSADGWGS